MIDAQDHVLSPLLHAELRWLVRLRWVAGCLVVVGALADYRWLGWYGRTGPMLGVGAGVLAFNAAASMTLARVPHLKDPVRTLHAAAWAQILFDLACLTLLAVWTGGVLSPILGFYVFHMVFAGMVLSRAQAYAAAGAGVVMLLSALRLTGPWAQDRAGNLVVAGWIATLAVTVYLTARITSGLHAREHVRLRQRRRLRRMSARLAAQQRAMIQHEKLVAMGQLAAGVAHEIANPLASMDGMLQLMQRHPETPRPDAVSSLREQIRRIHRTVAQLTGFAHPDKGLPESTDINELVRSTLKMLAFDHRLRRVTVECDLGATVGRAMVIPRALQQVLINLVINALDAMTGVTQPRLLVRTVRHDAWCTIEVIDNGHGIPSDKLDRIFKPFFTTKPVGKGTGLGLSISLALVHEQGGHLEVSSQAGCGATFTIKIPGMEPPPPVATQDPASEAQIVQAV